LHQLIIHQYAPNPSVAIVKWMDVLKLQMKPGNLFQKMRALWLPEYSKSKSVNHRFNMFRRRCDVRADAHIFILLSKPSGNSFVNIKRSTFCATAKLNPYRYFLCWLFLWCNSKTRAKFFASKISRTGTRLATLPFALKSFSSFGNGERRIFNRIGIINRFRQLGFKNNIQKRLFAFFSKNHILS